MDDITLYCNVMEEIKRRFAVVELFLEGKCSTLYKATDVECMALQMRHILELIALGSIVTVREEYCRQYEKFANHWHAVRILRDVKKINPDFYPKPVKEVPDKTLEAKSNLVCVDDAFLTIEEFVDVYDQCGTILHARNPLSGPKEYDKYEMSIACWMSKIRVLLNTHQIRLLNNDQFLLVHMKENSDDKVHAYVFTKR